jgi:acetoin utilization deacetylase AcuC-like enzyme
LVLFSSSRFNDHVMPPGHPERVERALVMQRVAAEFAANGGVVLEPRAATAGELARVHEMSYVEGILSTSGRAVAFDPDTFTSPKSVEVALLAAGAVVEAVDLVMDSGGPKRALALVRPPGHHAERDRAMGLCLFNSIAVGAAHARASGLDRVAIVDYDVHHGNGTQWMFYDDPSVLFISSHQYPYYPGTGAASETGKGAGTGFTVNLPLEAGADDADFELIYQEVVRPVLRQFQPQLILLSAGFDAWDNDPLGGLRLSSTQYGRLTAMLAEMAGECCEGRLVAVTEGGYDLTGLAECIRAAIDALAGGRTVDSYPMPSGPAARGNASIAAFRTHLPEL